MNCVRILALQKKCRVKFYQWLLASTGMSEAGGGVEGYSPPPPDINQGGQVMSTKFQIHPFRFSDLPSSLLHTMSWPRHGNFNHGNCTQQWNNPHMQLDSPIKHSSVEHFFFFPFKLSHFSTLTFERKHVHRAEISRERVSLQI